MGMSHSIPEYNIPIADRPVLFCPHDQSVATLALVGIITCSKIFLFIKWSYPYMVLHKTGPFSPICIFRSERDTVVARHELIGNRLSYPVFSFMVYNLPVPRSFEV